MLAHTKTHRTEIKIDDGKTSHCYKVPKSVAIKIIDTISKYENKKDKSIPWRDVVKDEIDTAGSSSAYFVRGAREEVGLTQTKMAEKLGIQRSNLSNIENGKRPIGKVLARKLGKMVKVDYRVFL